MLVVAASCAVGPNFQRPAPPSVVRYSSGAGVRETIPAGGVAQVVRPGAALAAQWWQLFHSHTLDQLVTEALARNPSIEAARASLQRSRYSLAAGYGVFYPQLDASGSFERQRFTPSRFGIQTPPTEFNLWTLEGTVGYTLDVFGGERRTVEGLRAQVDVQCYTLAAARLSVTGNVVQTAIASAGYRAQIVATEELVTSLREQVAITQTQVRAGTTPVSTLLSFQGQLASTLATLPPLRVRAVQADDLLATLIGRPPAAWRPPAIELAEIALPGELPVSLPSDLARQRPDILEAEATLHVASTNIGVAAAAMFPSFAVSGAMGASNTTLGTLFTPAGWLWSIAGNLTAPLFHGGTLANQHRAAIAAYEQSVANYRQTVIGALADVANALAALELDAETLDAQLQAVAAWTEARKLIEANYATGLTNYIQVLITQDSYLEARLGQIQAQAQRLQDTVALFIALGGGWWSDQPKLCRN
jgi:NodT family efflux transporter outer membrane factor (OMF) lipoprotein